MQFNEYNGWNPPVYILRPRRKYGFFRFMLDLFLVAVTSGLWILWIIIREIRNR